MNATRISQAVIKQLKDNPISERMSIEYAALWLVDREYYRTIDDAMKALLSGVPVQTHFSVFTLAYN